MVRDRAFILQGEELTTFKSYLWIIGKGQNPMNTAPKLIRELSAQELNAVSGGTVQIGTRENEGGTGDKGLIISENEGGTGLI